eukprot:11224541-Lingulodinium_polyedra.AAC.1
MGRVDREYPDASCALAHSSPTCPPSAPCAVRIMGRSSGASQHQVQCSRAGRCRRSRRAAHCCQNLGQLLSAVLPQPVLGLARGVP